MYTVPCVVLGLSEDILLILMILQIYFLASCWSLKLFGSKLCLHIFRIWVKYVRWIFWVLPIPFIFNFSATSSGFSLDRSLHPTLMIKCLGDFSFWICSIAPLMFVLPAQSTGILSCLFLYIHIGSKNFPCESMLTSLVRFCVFSV